MKRLIELCKKLNSSHIKIMVVFFLVITFFFGKTYATESSGDDLNILATIMHFLVGILNWIWILLANLAGKFMTNSFVYGGVLGLDKYIFVLWNIIKNFANYMLGFFLLFLIFKNIFKSDGGVEIKKTLPKILLAGVLIQASWFLFAVMVDFSTILVAGLGSFPSQFLESNTDFSKTVLQDGLSSLGQYRVEVYNDSAEGQRWTKTTEELSESDINTIVDSIMPKGDNLAGPLMYLGLSIFKFQDNNFQNLEAAGTNISTILTSIGINAIIIIVFTIVLFLLFITNLFRVLVLWIAIPLSPLIVLLNTIDSLKGIKGQVGKLLGSILEIKNIIKLLMKPVIFTLFLSLILVMATTMKDVIGSNQEEVLLGDGGVTIENSNTDSSISSENMFSFSMKNTKKGVSDLIVNFFTLFLLVALARIAIKTETGIGFIDKTMKDVDTLLKNNINNIGLIPVPTKDGVKMVGLNAAKRFINPESGDMINYINRLDDDSVKSMAEKYGLQNLDPRTLAMKGDKDWWLGLQEDLLKEGSTGSLLSGGWAESYLPIWINSKGSNGKYRYNNFNARMKNTTETLVTYFSDNKNKGLLKEIARQLVNSNGTSVLYLGDEKIIPERIDDLESKDLKKLKIKKRQ